MPKKRVRQRVLVLTNEVPLLLTEEVPVNNHMRSFLVAICLALVVILLVNIRLQFQLKQLADTDGVPEYKYVWIKPWETKPFLLPKAKPAQPYQEHYEVVLKEEKKQFLTVWRVIRIAMQIYN
tara:strand:+ start:235 stop:603 length:369 start_codon:yes stop_codon:yes gene_type:complete